jgi:tetratricopeptide (TPR) repeat protein
MYRNYNCPVCLEEWRTKMTINSLVEKTVKPKTAIVLIIATVILVLGVGLTIGYLFVWNAYDKDSKIEHDFKIAKTKVNTEPNNVEARIALGWSFVQLGKMDKAQEQYENALKLDPKNQVARYNIALIKVESKDLNGAKAELEALKAENPQYWAARATLGYVYRELSEFKSAVQELELVDAFEPGRPDVLYQLGLTYEKMGDKPKAKASYAKALKYNPNDQEVQKALSALK